jgi:hypothetical protein
MWREHASLAGPFLKDQPHVITPRSGDVTVMAVLDLEDMSADEVTRSGRDVGRVDCHMTSVLLC